MSYCLFEHRLLCSNDIFLHCENLPWANLEQTFSSRPRLTFSSAAECYLSSCINSRLFLICPLDYLVPILCAVFSVVWLTCIIICVWWTRKRRKERERSHPPREEGANNQWAPLNPIRNPIDRSYSNKDIRYECKNFISPQKRTCDAVEEYVEYEEEEDEEEERDEEMDKFLSHKLTKPLPTKASDASESSPVKKSLQIGKMDNRSVKNVNASNFEGSRD